VAKHFIDMLQVLEDKTKNNLTPAEKTLLDQVLYEMRMSFVQIAGGAPPGAGAAPRRGNAVSRSAPDTAPTGSLADREARNPYLRWLLHLGLPAAISLLIH